MKTAMWSVGAVALSMMLSGMTWAADPAVKLNPDGSIVVPSFVLPFSHYASPEARANFEFTLNLGRQPRGGIIEREGPEKPSALFTPWMDAQKQRYDVTITNEELGGVGVQIFVPKSGITAKNKQRVLINLHGGGFSSGWPFGAQLESIPFAAVGGIRVVSVDYRMLPEHHFPAASEDVEKVYRALLKTYKPSEIGIYGCSAGGILTGEVVAWLQKAGLPRPAAVGIFSAYTSFVAGDSYWIASRLGSLLPPPAGLTPPDNRTTGYWQGTKAGDPLATPGNSVAVLEKFPPTLFITGTRAFDMSGVVYSHVQLVKAGVDARLYLWDGVDHCFTYNPAMPESREAYDVTVKFFEEAMDRAAGKRK